MIPLFAFLIIWVVLLGVFGVITLLTLSQVLRHGLPASSTYLVTFFFLVVVSTVVVASVLFVSQVDWSTSVALLPSGIGGWLPGTVEIPL
ncbi:MAG: hypothetical protein RL141_150 [Candidatus Parcubacteria bacterium]|jgi:hypothetical protein